MRRGDVLDPLEHTAKRGESHALWRSRMQQSSADLLERLYCALTARAELQVGKDHHTWRGVEGAACVVGKHAHRGVSRKDHRRETVARS